MTNPAFGGAAALALAAKHPRLAMRVLRIARHGAIVERLATVSQTNEHVILTLLEDPAVYRDVLQVIDALDRIMERVGTCEDLKAVIYEDAPAKI